MENVEIGLDANLRFMNEDEDICSFKELYDLVQQINNKKDVYSTKETLTNKIYVDSNGTEHKVYRKMFRVNVPSQTGWKAVATADYISTIIDISGHFTGNDGRQMPINQPENGAQLSTSFLNGKIEMNTYYSAWFGRPAEIILEYTKKN